MKLKTRIFWLNALVVAALLGVGVVTIVVFRQVASGWKNYQETIITKTNYVTFLRAQMGYGGAIHDFKNYVLRGEERYYNLFMKRKQRILSIVQGYRSIGRLSKKELESLKLLEDMVTRYERAINDASALWKGKTSDEVYVKIRYLETMTSNMGYGGVIHDLKNYIIRSDEKYLRQFKKAYSNMMAALNGYEAFGNLTEVEAAALKALQEMGDQYSERIDQVQKLKQQGLSIEEIDRQIILDDAPYLAALDQLGSELDFAREVRRTIEEQTTIDDTPYLDALITLSKELSNETADMTQQLSARMNFGSVLIMLIAFISTGVAILFCVTLAFSISKQFNVLIGRIKFIEKTGDLNSPLKVTNDEFGVLAQSFNNMLASLKTAKDSLDEKTKELSNNLETSELQNKLLEDTKKATLNVLEDLEQSKQIIEKERAELDEKSRDLEKVNKELDSFVYTASHDLRAPLRGISSFATFLEEDYKDKLDDQGRDYIEEIRRGANRMSKLIEDLLTLSRISRIRNPYEDVDIKELIKSVLERIAFDIEEKKVEMVLAEDLPTIHCDRIKIAEVFLNLVNNGIKFSSKQSDRKPRIEINYSLESDSHKFSVKDNGIGIDPKYHDQIFGVFKRLHTAEEYEGTGAGLSIVKKVIDDHGGKIWIESEFGKGASFCFTIPKVIAPQKKKLGEILVDDGLVSKDELEKSLEKQKNPDDPPPYHGGLSD